ncbi:MAG: 4Fe-4S binding protein [Coriobacteriales bacterium]|nr:4Fe-4S binding protein [Coriobacteriales bacterium]
MTSSPAADVEGLDFVGLAASTDFFGVPRIFERFVESLPRQEGTPAFVFNTFGAISGATLLSLSDIAEARGFDVLDGHSLRMPESYPRMIARGLAAANAPSQRRMDAFDAFTARLTSLAEDVSEGRRVEKRKLPGALLGSVLRSRPRTTARDDMGEKVVDTSACTGCGTCARNCPYGAIVLDGYPAFDMSTCFGCWRCYNRCPSRAIHVENVPSTAFYTGPSKVLRSKFAR